MPLSPLPAGTFLIVANARSGHASLDALQAAVQDVLGQAGRPYHLILIQDADQLAACLREAVTAAQDCQGTLVVAGGDGTLNTLANLLPACACPVGILPLGTFNYFAREHGIPTDLQGALINLLQAKAQPVTLGMVNQRRFLVNASLGLYPQLLEEREVLKQKLGRWRLVALVSALFTFLHAHRPLYLKLDYANRSSQHRLLTLFVTNSRLQAERLGLDVPQESADSRLTVLLVRPGGRWVRLGLLLRSALQRLEQAEQVRSFRFSQLTVTPSFRLHPARIKVALDGEVTWLKPPLCFQQAPEPLYLLKPAADEEAACP